MSDLQAVRKQIYKLSVLERLELLEAIAQSLQSELRPRPKLPENFLMEMRGLGKTDNPPPTDAEVSAMKEERLVEKYLK
ncbi:MAG: hypothetical protein AB4352_15205 [Hormoscilla sp.]